MKGLNWLRGLSFLIGSFAVILGFQNCSGGFSGAGSVVDPNSATGKAIAQNEADEAIDLLYQPTIDCLRGGDGRLIQQRLDQGELEVILCAGQTFNIHESLVIRKEGQKIFTAGLPSGDNRAVLKVVNAKALPVIVSNGFQTSLRNIIIKEDLPVEVEEAPRSVSALSSSASESAHASGSSEKNNDTPIVSVNSFKGPVIDSVKVESEAKVEVGSDNGSCKNAAVSNSQMNLSLGCKESLVVETQPAAPLEPAKNQNSVASVQKEDPNQAKMKQLEEFRTQMANRDEPHAKYYHVDTRTPEEIAAEVERMKDLKRHVMRGKFALFATGFMPLEEKHLKQIEELGMMDEWLRVKEQWRKKLVVMTEEQRDAAGVKILDEESLPAPSASRTPSSQSTTAAPSAAAPVAAPAPSTSQRTQLGYKAMFAKRAEEEARAATQGEEPEVVQPPVVEVEEEQSAPVAEVAPEKNEASKCTSFRVQTLRYVMRKMIPLMGTGIVKPKTDAEFEAVCLKEEWDTKKEQWQDKVKAMTEEEREAAGVSLLEELEE